MTVTIRVGDCRDVLRAMPAESVHCVVTSPPYYGLRAYGSPPQVWGGDPACEHDFQMETVTGEIRTGLGLAELGKRYRGGGHKQGAVPKITAERGFCRCGSWCGDLGLEPTWQLYLDHMVAVFDEVWRVLRDDGVCWINMGDSYASATGAQQRDGPPSEKSTLRGNGHEGGGPKLHALNPIPSPSRGYRGDRLANGRRDQDAILRVKTRGGTSARRPASGKHAYVAGAMPDDRVGSNRAQRGDGNDGIAFGPSEQPNRVAQPGMKAKDMMGMPWRLALALQERGWWLRKALPWLKRNPMPESTTDRPTTAVEYVFLLAKSERYYWDADAVARKASPNTNARVSQDVASQAGSTRANGGAKTNGTMKAVIKRPKRAEPDSGIRANDSFENATCHQVVETRNWRDADLFFDSLEPPFGLICDADGEPLAIDATTQPFKAAHFATFPPRLIEPLIKAGCPTGGTVLDPFGGAGTTGLVADRLGRDAILIELNPEYAAMAERRIKGDAGMFASVAAE